MFLKLQLQILSVKNCCVATIASPKCFRFIIDIEIEPQKQNYHKLYYTRIFTFTCWILFIAFLCIFLVTNIIITNKRDFPMFAYLHTKIYKISFFLVLNYFSKLWYEV